jgi:hypothetical protein
MARTRTDLGVVATGTRTALIDRAASGPGIQKKTVIITTPRQSENAAALMKMIDNALSLKPSSYGFQWLTALELVSQAQPDQIVQPHFDRHRATGSVTLGTKLLFKADPGFRALTVGADDQT